MRYAEYAEIVELSTWLSLDQKYGGGSPETGA
jgi:hypothetical protein